MGLIFESGDRIVFAGDSVTDMGSYNPVGSNYSEGLGRSYVRVIESLLSAIYPEKILQIWNSGISGDTTRDLLKRFDRDVIALDPDWVSICIGINDVWHQYDAPMNVQDHVSPEEYRENIRKMILSLPEKTKGVFLCSPYYIEGYRNDAVRKRMDEYCEIVRSLAEEYHAIYVDFQKLYEDYTAYRHSSYITWDRVHPNQVGATLMAREFLSHCGFDYAHQPAESEKKFFFS